MLYQCIAPDAGFYHLQVEAHMKEATLEGGEPTFFVRTCSGRFDDPVPEVKPCTTTVSRTAPLTPRCDEMVQVYARQLCERLGRPILLSVALQDDSPPVFRAICDHVASRAK